MVSWVTKTLKITFNLSHLHFQQTKDSETLYLEDILKQNQFQIDQTDQGIDNLINNPMHTNKWVQVNIQILESTRNLNLFLFKKIKCQNIKLLKRSKGHHLLNNHPNIHISNIMNKTLEKEKVQGTLVDLCHNYKHQIWKKLNPS